MVVGTLQQVPSKGRISIMKIQNFTVQKRRKYTYILKTNKRREELEKDIFFMGTLHKYLFRQSQIPNLPTKNTDFHNAEWFCYLINKLV